MAVRLKLRITAGERVAEAVALLNSGYEAPTPQLLIPISLATKLGFWPPENASEVTLDTAGGPLRAWFYPMAAKISVITEETCGREATADIIVSPLLTSPLLTINLQMNLK